MTGLTDSGVLTRTYAHNARGERVAKRDPTVTGGDLSYVYDEAGRLLGEYDAAGARIKEYVWLDDTLVAVLGAHGGSDHQYVLTDHLGTPRAVVHPGTNAIVWRWDLTGSAFGDHAAQTDPDGDTVAYTFNLRYPGQYFDAETGLHYNYFRDYDPSTGRYVQSDPIGLQGGASTYGYVGGRPISATDPLGLFSTLEWCKRPENIQACLDAGLITRAPKGAVIDTVASLGASAALAGLSDSSSETCPDDSKCKEIYAAINRELAILKKRYWDLALDKNNLFIVRPSGKNSWKGHQQQFRQHQESLRDLLDAADRLGCKGYPFDAWLYATRNTPERPFSK